MYVLLYNVNFVRTDLVVFKEFVVWWHVWRVNGRQSEVCFSPDEILCGWLGSKYQLTNYEKSIRMCYRSHDSCCLRTLFGDINPPAPPISKYWNSKTGWQRYPFSSCRIIPLVTVWRLILAPRPSSPYSWVWVSANISSETSSREAKLTNTVLPFSL